MASAGTNTIRRSKRLKWTEQMNRDCLDWKRKAHIMISSDDPPLYENGRRKKRIHQSYERAVMNCAVYITVVE